MFVALLSARLRRWLLMAVALPILRVFSRQLADRIERRRGPSRTTKVLHRAGEVGRRRR